MLIYGTEEAGKTVHDLRLGVEPRLDDVGSVVTAANRRYDGLGVCGRLLEVLPDLAVGVVEVLEQTALICPLNGVD